MWSVVAWLSAYLAVGTVLTIAMGNVSKHMRPSRLREQFEREDAKLLTFVTMVLTWPIGLALVLVCFIFERP